MLTQLDIPLKMVIIPGGVTGAKPQIMFQAFRFQIEDTGFPNESTIEPHHAYASTSFFSGAGYQESTCHSIREDVQTVIFKKKQHAQVAKTLLCQHCLYVCINVFGFDRHCVFGFSECAGETGFKTDL